MSLVPDSGSPFSVPRNGRSNSKSEGESAGRVAVAQEFHSWEWKAHIFRQFSVPGSQFSGKSTKTEPGVSMGARVEKERKAIEEPKIG